MSSVHIKYQSLSNVCRMLELCATAAQIHTEQFDVGAVEHQLRRAADCFKEARKIVDALKKEEEEFLADTDDLLPNA